MPRIPTRDSLQQGVPRSAGGIESAPRDFVGPALREAGKRVADIAEGAGAREGRQHTDELQRAALELASARAHWKASLLTEQNAFAAGRYPDHENWTRTYRANAGTMQKQATGMISDSEVRQRFFTETQEDLEQVAAAIDGQAREAGMKARRRKAERSLLQQVEIAAAQPDEDAKAVMAGVRASLQDLVDTRVISAEEAAARSVSYARQFAGLKTLALTKQDPALAVSVLNDEPLRAARLVRQLYGFRPTSYWQDGANRAGYGSDTITGEDGSVVTVSPGMTVARAEAERDLKRRTEEARNSISDQLGAKTFNRLAPHVQAVLISVGYATGSLPEQVASAARSGDEEAVAAAISADADEDAGINEEIRHKQAEIVRGEGGEPVTSRPWWADMLEPEQRSALLAAASRELERVDAAHLLAARTHAFKVAHGVRSHLRSAYMFGSPVDIDAGEVLAELGPERHRQWIETRQDADDVAEKTANMPMLPDAQIVQLVEAHRPKPSERRAEREQKVHERVAMRADEIMRERRDNPARAALRVPSVRRALFEAQHPLATSPQKVQALVREMAAAQSALGVATASIAPVPDEWAVAIGAALLGTSAGTHSQATDQLRAARANINSYFGEFSDDVIVHSISRAGALRSRLDTPEP